MSNNCALKAFRFSEGYVKISKKSAEEVESKMLYENPKDFISSTVNYCSIRGCVQNLFQIFLGQE